MLRVKCFATIPLLLFLAVCTAGAANEKADAAVEAKENKAADAKKDVDRFAPVIPPARYSQKKEAPAAAVKTAEYIPADTLGFPITPKEPGFGAVETLKMAGAPAGEFRRVTVSQTPANPWHIQLQAGIKAPIRKGKTYLLVFDARAVDTNRAVGTANLIIRNPPAFTTLARSNFSVGKAWSTVVIPMVAAEDSPDGKTAIALHLGGAVQKIDIGALRFMDCWPDFPKDLLPRG